MSPNLWLDVKAEKPVSKLSIGGVLPFLGYILFLVCIFGPVAYAFICLVQLNLAFQAKYSLLQSLNVFLIVIVERVFLVIRLVLQIITFFRCL
jgi:hypothetical protein